MANLKNLFRLMLGIKPDPEDFTWRCHVCKEERPDQKIGVYVKRIQMEGLSGTENILYCNDREECIVKAKTF